MSLSLGVFCYFKQKTAYEMRISDWSSDVCSSDLQALWEAMKANGDIYLGRYEGWYSIRDEAFYDEKELTEGEGGAKLSPQGTPVEWTVEESWFFRLSAYADRPLAHYAAPPEFHTPAGRRNEGRMETGRDGKKEE